MKVHFLPLCREACPTIAVFLAFLLPLAPAANATTVNLVNGVLEIKLLVANDFAILQRSGATYIVTGSRLNPLFTAPIAAVSSINVEGEEFAPNQRFTVKEANLPVTAPLTVDRSVELTQVNGGIEASGSVTILSPLIQLNAGVRTTTPGGGQFYDGTVILGINTALSADDGPMTFLRDVESGADNVRRLVVFHGEGLAVFRGAVGSPQRPLESLRMERSPVRLLAASRIYFGLVEEPAFPGYTRLDFDLGEGQGFDDFNVEIDGTFFFNLPDAAEGTVYTVVETPGRFQPLDLGSAPSVLLPPTYRNNFRVEGFDPDDDGNWRRENGGKVWFFSEAFGVLRVAPQASQIPGRYQGVLTGANFAIGDFQIQGGIDLRVDARGGYTGRATLDGKVFRGRGEVSEGAIRAPWESKDGELLNLDLYWDAVEGLGAFRGGAELGGVRWGIDAGRANFDKRNPLPEGLAGPCTAQFFMGAVIPDDAPVYGSGFATGSFRPNGGARLAGRLPDGTRFTASAPVWGGTVDRGGEQEFRGYLRFCVPLYRGAGFFGADLQLEGGNPAQWEGDQSWRSPSFVDGGINAYLSGPIVRYDKPPKGQSALPSWPVVDGLHLGSASFTADGANVIAPVSLALDARNRLTVTGDNPTRLKLSFNAAKGTIRGSFRDPASGKPLRFEGTADQRSGLLTGYFLTPQASSGLFMAEPLVEP